MRFIFFAYWIWYTSSLIANSFVLTEMWIIRIVGMSTFLSFAFICMAPLYYLIHERRGHRSDPVYMNACLNAGVIRTVIWCFAFYGLTDTSVIFAMNAFGMFVFILMERKMKKLSDEYFKW